MNRNALHRIVALLFAAIMLALTPGAAAQDAPPLDPIPTPTIASAPPADEIAGANAVATNVIHLPLVIRPEPYPPVNRQWELEFIRLLTRNASATDCTRSASTRSSPSPPAAMRMTSASTRCRAAIAAADAGTGAPTARNRGTAWSSPAIPDVTKAKQFTAARMMSHFRCNGC